MPQSLNETVRNTFIQGLITERNELTFPENASTDEDNCDLLKDGSRRRRLGLVQEDSGILSDDVASTSSTIFTTHKWENVGEVEGLEYIVVQMGNLLIFYEETSGALSGSNLTDADPLFGIDLDTYVRPKVGADAATAPIQVASIKGSLVVASPEINTLQVEYGVGGLTATEIAFRVRDYAWMGDVSEYETLSSTTPSVARQYDTKNTGWSDGPGGVGDAALTTYSSGAGGAMPPLTHPWYSGKNSTGVFNVGEWGKIYAGSTLITNGHYILDLYSKDRDTISGLTGVTAGVEDARFSTVATYAGRMFYSGMNESTDDNGSKIFFSRIIEDGFDFLGELHQINDPTSEELSDLLDTDGGFILIPEAYGIKKLHTFGPDLYVFADNGVWRISGVDDVFRATEYSVSKLAEDGLISAEAFVSASGRPYWWSYGGIYTIAANEQGTVAPQNISISSIQTFVDRISLAKRQAIRSGYDEVTRRIFWAYPSSTTTEANKLDRFLLFDEVLGAFIPWSISDKVTDTPWVVAVGFSNGKNEDIVDYTVSAQVRILYRDTTGAISWAEFTDLSFLDWGEADYSSYAETAYDFMGSMLPKKNAPYVLSVMKVTETGWSLTEGDYVPVRGSSCRLRAKWDFRTTYSSSAQEAYRLKSTPIVDPLDLTSFGYPYTAVQTKLKVRGRGRVVQLRWESNIGKDFHLLGWSMLGATNATI